MNPSVHLIIVPTFYWTLWVSHTNSLFKCKKCYKAGVAWKVTEHVRTVRAIVNTSGHLTPGRSEPL